MLWKSSPPDRSAPARGADHGDRARLEEAADRRDGGEPVALLEALDRRPGEGGRQLDADRAVLRPHLDRQAALAEDLDHLVVLGPSPRPRRRRSRCSSATSARWASRIVPRPLPCISSAIANATSALPGGGLRGRCPGRRGAPRRASRPARSGPRSRRPPSGAPTRAGPCRRRRTGTPAIPRSARTGTRAGPPRPPGARGARGPSSRRAGRCRSRDGRGRSAAIRR